MKYIGAHVSAAGGVQNAPLNAKAIGANAFALFTKNQRQWMAKPLTSVEVEAFKENCQKANILSQHILPHDSYLINLAQSNPEKSRQSLEAFIDEMRRCEQLGLHLLNFHPGSHLNEVSETEALRLIGAAINRALEATQTCMAIIENTAGQGTNLGYSFEHIAEIISHVKYPKRVGVCIDTCHLYSAGYDFTNPFNFELTFSEFERLIGFKNLCAMHLNDDLKPRASRVDRHAPIGDGTLTVEPFKMIMKDSRFNEIPLILETPDESRWAAEIVLLRNFSALS